MFTRRYRGKVEHLRRYAPQVQTCYGSKNVRLTSEEFSGDSNKRSEYSCIITPEIQLKVALACLDRLSDVAGVEYGIAVIVDGKVVKWL